MLIFFKKAFRSFKGVQSLKSQKNLAARPESNHIHEHGININIIDYIKLMNKHNKKKKKKWKGDKFL